MADRLLGPNSSIQPDPERRRLAEGRGGGVRWDRFGPYLSERQWGTVREDYSAHGEAWEYFPHDHARSRAYRWGEDGIAGFSDHHQRICVALALWNGKDPILKERLFGLANAEGNHGEDVKEQYYYLDATPTHSYLKFLYKYPQRAFPYAELVARNRAAGRHEPEFELCDTGIFDDDRYFDVFVEYAKRDANDVLFRVRVVNRGPEAHELHVLPHVWFRNVWSWDPSAARPSLSRDGASSVSLDHPEMGRFSAYFAAPDALLFCEDETNYARLFGMQGAPYPKDAIGEYVVSGARQAVNPDQRGTKCAAHLVPRWSGFTAWRAPETTYSPMASFGYGAPCIPNRRA